MKEDQPKLSLDRPVTYQIKVPGILDESWSGLNWDLKILPGCDEQAQPITVFIATVDQAALHSLLRRLYAMGLPLISIQMIGSGS
jgi:hypothetical protein